MAAQLRATKRLVLASFLEHAEPAGVSATGVVSIRAADEASAEGLEAGRQDVLGALRALYPAVQRVAVVRGDGEAPRNSPPRRMTEGAVREEKMAALRKSDPVLDAAIDALDLELLE